MSEGTNVAQKEGELNPKPVETNLENKDRGEVLFPPKTNQRCVGNRCAQVVSERADDAVRDRTPPCPFKPGESKPTPGYKKHAAVMVKHQERNGMALGDPNERVNEVHILGQMKDLKEKSKRARHKLIRCQMLGRAEQAGDAA